MSLSDKEKTLINNRANCFMANLLRNNIKTAVLIYTYTDEGAYWVLDSVEGSEYISPQLFEYLETTWWESTDATGASMDYMTDRFHHVREGERMTLFLDQRINGF